jgi:hypothetical protein
MTTARLTLAVLFAASIAPFAQAQTPGSYPAPAQGGVQFYGHASTFAEGAQRGHADVIRSAGEFEYNAALARLINQDAYSKAIDNDFKAAETFFKKREMNKYYRDAARPPKATAEALSRFSQERAPDRLTENQIDMTLGAIYWPAVLESEVFTISRVRMETLFEQRSEGSSGLGSQNYRDIQLVAKEMQSVLKGLLRSVAPSDYLLAKKFIDGLAMEARFPYQVDGPNANQPVGVAAAERAPQGQELAARPAALVAD